MESFEYVSKIRNFCIISHVDHGKSTLCDRMLELTGTIPKNKLKEQFLDQMDIERERGITIKLQPVKMSWSGITLFLIDTPGHVDFSYEVSRSLAAVEGAVLLVDATQGIESQTISNYQLAKDQGLKIIPVINKIDLPNADIEKTKQTMVETFGFEPKEIILASGKTGAGVAQILDRIVTTIPAPQGNNSQPLQALVFDSIYDQFKGVIAYVKITEGSVKQNEEIFLMGTKTLASAIEVGIFNPQLQSQTLLQAGEIGYIATGLKNVALCRVGDTITLAANPAGNQLPGYREIKPMVFAAFYPVDADKFEEVREALGKLQLTDGALSFEPESSSALGFGFRCGFLGLLHLEVVQERLEREYSLNLIATAPTVKYEIETTKNEIIEIQNPSKLPPPNNIKIIKEPWVNTTITTPARYLGSILELLNQKRAVVLDLTYFGEKVLIKAQMPLSEVITDFFDRLKSLTSGYGSLDYELIGYRQTNVTKLQILVNGELVDALSSIVPTEKAVYVGRALVEKLKTQIPRSQVEIAIQATINGKVIARETISAYRKDVIAKLYGGDRTRKDKLLDKQREGKKRMKQIGQVQIPQEAFLAVLRQKDLS